jgi:hypothetical protein
MFVLKLQGIWHCAPAYISIARCSRKLQLAIFLLDLHYSRLNKTSLIIKRRLKPAATFPELPFGFPPRHNNHLWA